MFGKALLGQPRGDQDTGHRAARPAQQRHRPMAGLQPAEIVAKQHEKPVAARIVHQRRQTGEKFALKVHLSAHARHPLYRGIGRRRALLRHEQDTHAPPDQIGPGNLGSQYLHLVTRHIAHAVRITGDYVGNMGRARRF